MSRGAKESQVVFDGGPALIYILWRCSFGLVFAAAVFWAFTTYYGRGLDWVLDHLPAPTPAEVVVTFNNIAQGIVWFIIALSAWRAVVGALDLVRTRYLITNQHIRLERGIFTRHIDNLELARVKDVRLVQPFVLRLFGGGHLMIISTDPTTPYLRVEGVLGAQELLDRLTGFVRPDNVYEVR